uniref:Uncharacterized protein n=1 Tax=Physcomitrium patens TaxID=3218 RepID=A0A2K1I9I1_PHYPA|nr:hypothetical protein PHYPA_031295 [Physcomitrium patens]
MAEAHIVFSHPSLRYSVFCTIYSVLEFAISRQTGTMISVTKGTNSVLAKFECNHPKVPS